MDIKEVRNWLLQNSNYKIMIDLNALYGCIEVIGYFKGAIIKYRSGQDVEKNVVKVYNFLKQHSEELRDASIREPGN